jgi:hypothetical protein
MRIYKLLNFNPEIRDGDRLLAKAVNLLAAIEETIVLLSSEAYRSQIPG